MNISNNLRISLGLSEQELKVYLSALELGGATMQSLARKSGVNRSTIYTFIDDLKDRGFITETKKGKRRTFDGMDPEQLLELERGRLDELEKILPSIKAIDNRSDGKPKVTFYEGIQGIKEVYADMLNKSNTEIWAYEDIEALKDGLPTDYYEYFPKERAKKGILLKSISRDSITARTFTKNNIGLLRETKFLKTEELGTDINIYENKVALMNLQKKSQMAVIIEDVKISETFRILWEELWNRL